MDALDGQEDREASKPRGSEFASGVASVIRDSDMIARRLGASALLIRGGWQCPAGAAANSAGAAGYYCRGRVGILGRPGSHFKGSMGSKLAFGPEANRRGKVGPVEAPAKSRACSWWGGDGALRGVPVRMGSAARSRR